MRRRRLAPSFVALLLAACRPPAPAPVRGAAEQPPIAPRARHDVTVHRFSLQDGLHTVDVRVPTALPPPRPAVISFLGEEDALLDVGIAVVTYTTHVERLRDATPKPPSGPQPTYGKWLLASPDPGTVGDGYLKLIVGTAERTIPAVIGALSAFPDLDLGRLGIAGTSTNGFVVLQALMAEPRLAAGAAIAACGDYHRFLQGSFLGMAGGPLRLDPDYESWLHAKEPVRHPERLVHAALLMMNGSEDPAIPARCATETARSLRRAYRTAHASRRFRFRLLQGKGHDIQAQARTEVLAWFRRWLVGPAAR
jgi:hypothetical protein